jgi:TolB-like protein/tRNA A-37 threonylcarbamoyl transferase component Bud32/Flp pilus assembly protein TadD
MRLQAALARRYEIERELGRGGMATVYLARDLKHERRVAIKVLKPEFTATLGPQRFLRETKLTAQLNHPNILPLLDSGESDGILFYIMPYVQGESLRQRLDRERQLTLEAALQIVREVGDALSYAHARGVIHRDIKPENVLLASGHAVLADFGVARTIEGPAADQLTQAGSAVGTPAYMSPEQATGSHQLDGRADIYSLACVLYEMLAGEPPFSGRSAQATMARAAVDPPQPLRTLRPSVPATLEQAVLRALAKAPADRFETSAAFIAALDSALAANVRLPAGRRLPRVALATGIALALGCAGLAAGWLASRLRGTVPADSIAVLPFENLSSDETQEHFAEGISEDLLDLLTRVPELRVAARTSSFSFKGQKLDVREIARRLHVANVLEGSVRSAGGEVRISARLVRATDGYQVWSQTWDRRLDDIFAIQDSIGSDVARQLRVRLLGTAARVHKTDARAYALFLQARAVARQNTIQALAQSDSLLQHVLQVDSGYAPAWTEFARNFANEVSIGVLPSEQGLRQARDAAEHALVIDTAYAPAFARLGWVATMQGDLGGAARELEQALALSPGDLDVLGRSAVLLTCLGRLPDAIRVWEFVVARDPVNASAQNALGMAYLWGRRYRDALGRFRTALSLSPGFGAAHYESGVALLMEGKAQVGLAEMQQEPSDVWRLIGLALAYHTLGRTAQSDSALGRLIEKYAKDAPSNIAYLYAARDESDRAFQWLDRAVEYDDPGLADLPAENLFGRLHSDRRWLPFLRRLGKAPEQLARIPFRVTLPEGG